MGEGKILRSRGVGDPEERTSSTVIDATLICDKAMVD